MCASCRSVESSRRIIVVARRERESKDEEREVRCVCVSARTIFSSIVDIFEDETEVSPERRIVITALANTSTVGYTEFGLTMSTKRRRGPKLNIEHKIIHEGHNR